MTIVNACAELERSMHLMLGEIEHPGQRKWTRRKLFLAEMDRAVWRTFIPCFRAPTIWHAKNGTGLYQPHCFARHMPACIWT